MKACQFVKANGWQKAKDVLKNAHWENIAYGNGCYYSNSCSKNDVCLDELKQLVESHELIETNHGLGTCKAIILLTDSDETEYGNRLGVEYRKSSENPNDTALMFCDDGTWIASSYLNFELDTTGRFINIKRLKQAIADEESCL